MDEKQLNGLYRKFPEIKRYLKTYGCSSRDAEDLFQEALVILIRKTADPDFKLDVEPFFYVKSTCKLLWYNLARKQQKQIKFELDEENRALEDEWFVKEQKISRVESVMQQLGTQCRELLNLFYGMGWNMADIAKKIGLRNDKVAKAQKYRCLQKTKELLLHQVEESSSSEFEIEVQTPQMLKS